MLLQAHRHSHKRVSSPHFVPDFGPEVMASRHDAQMLTPRAVPVDPYAAWLEQREAARGETILG